MKAEWIDDCSICTLTSSGMGALLGFVRYQRTRCGLGMTLYRTGNKETSR
jgi:hypothetical protein